MSTSGIFTRKRSGLDNKVWIVMLVTILLSLTLVSYRLIKGPAVAPCTEPVIFVNGLKKDATQTYKTGELILFRTPISASSKVVWDFGDSSKTEDGFSPSHTYSNAGIFFISVTVNDECIGRTKVTVKVPELIVKDSAGNIVEHIVGNSQVGLGKYPFSTPDKANSYKWTIENDNNFTAQFGKEGSYSFRNPGQYTLKLVLDNDRNRTYRKDILVIDPSTGKKHENDGSVTPTPVIILPEKPAAQPLHNPDEDSPKVVAPVKPTVEARRIIGTSPQAFKSYLQALVCGGMEAKDFYKYLTDEGSTKVIGNKAYTTFDAFCKDIKGKKIEIESVDFKKDGDRITEINVTYDKKGRLARNPCKE